MDMDIQSVFNEHKAVTYIYQYFSKTEDHCLHAIKQTAKEAFDNNTYNHETMKKIPKAYLSNQDCSV